MIGKVVQLEIRSSKPHECAVVAVRLTKPVSWPEIDALGIKRSGPAYEGVVVDPQNSRYRKGDRFTVQEQDGMFMCGDRAFEKEAVQ